MSSDVFSEELIEALQDLSPERRRDMENSLRGFLGMGFLPEPGRRVDLRLVVDHRVTRHDGAAP